MASTLIFGALTALVFAPDTARAATSHSNNGVVVSTMKMSKFGTFLVSGKTVYTLKASATPCAAKCLKAWPEVLLPKGAKSATAGSGVSASKLGTIKRTGGLQVTYAGQPLYFFIKDKAPGQVNGIVKDTWGKWTIVVTQKASGGSGGGTTTTVPVGGGAGF
jgi:predicted lipoprotein with Yx(FWY)xxD motif